MQFPMQIVLVTILFAASEAATKTRFKSVKCTALNDTVAKIRYCYLKAYSRSYVTLNYGETRMHPLDKPIIITGSVKYRYGTIFREVIHVEFDLCTILDGAANSIGMAFLAVLKDSAPSVFRKCPLPAEEVDMRNITLNDNGWPSIIPTGVYKAELTFKGVMKLQLESNVLSDIKTSF